MYINSAKTATYRQTDKMAWRLNDKHESYQAKAKGRIKLFINIYKNKDMNSAKTATYWRMDGQDGVEAKW